MPSNAEMVDYLMPISTNYVLGGSRWSPYDTDCSGVLCAAFWHVFGIPYWRLGDYTGSQWAGDLLDTVWWGTTPYLPWESMQKGDVIFTSNCSSDFSSVNGSHVGLYTGNPSAPFLSHYANGGPYVTAVNAVYGGTECYFGVRRYAPGSEDDVSATDVWSYKNKGMNGEKDAYQLLTDIHDQLTRIDTAGWDNPQGHDFYGREQYIQQTVREVLAKVDNLTVGGAAVDYDKLAQALAPAVADEIYKRMKA